MSTLPLARDEIDLVAADPLPSRVADRRAIRAAIIATAARTGGLVHITDVRARIHRDVDPHQVGAYIARLVRLGVLVGTGEFRPNGDGSARNRTKPAEVRRLVGVVPEVTA